MLSGTGMASGIYQSSVFGRITMKCFLERFWAYSSGLLSGVFQWSAFGHFQWNAFEHWKEECLRVYPREMLSGIFQWNAFGQRGVFEHISVESFWANSGEMLWGILLGLS